MMMIDPKRKERIKIANPIDIPIRMPKKEIQDHEVLIKSTKRIKIERKRDPDPDLVKDPRALPIKKHQKSVEQTF